MNEASGGLENLRDPGARRRELTDLFDSHFDHVYRFCLARCGDPEVADEVTSESFVAAARVFAEGKGHGIDRPWLFVVARRRLYDHWRGARRHRRRAERLTQLARGSETSGEVAGDFDSERVLTALASLPERQRAAVSLRYLDEFSVSEVAEALEVGYRAAESLLARGRKAFTIAWEEAL